MTAVRVFTRSFTTRHSKNAQTGTQWKALNLVRTANQNRIHMIIYPLSTVRLPTAEPHLPPFHHSSQNTIIPIKSSRFVCGTWQISREKVLNRMIFFFFFLEGVGGRSGFRGKVTLICKILFTKLYFILLVSHS